MASLEFFPAITGAIIVAAYSCIGVVGGLWYETGFLHYVCSRLTVSKFVNHCLHVGLGVPEECLVTCAKIVQSIFTIGCLSKSLFGTAAVTSEAEFTFSTVLRKRISFVGSEFTLFWTFCHFANGCICYIAEVVLWIYK